MHLIPCSHPKGVLESAPRSSLSVSAEGDAWEGFWSVVDERYYARRTHPDGRQDWFRFADEEVAIETVSEVRVLPLRRHGRPVGRARRTVLVGTRGTRTVLVGRSRRERRERVMSRGGTR